MKEAIAERKLILINPDGNEFPITIYIGKPYRVDGVQWACSVEIEGLYKNLSDISGVDSFQSLMLAQRLIYNLLKHFVEDGGKILSVDKTNEVNLNILFESGV